MIGLVACSAPAADPVDMTITPDASTCAAVCPQAGAVSAEAPLTPIGACSFSMRYEPTPVEVGDAMGVPIGELALERTGVQTVSAANADLLTGSDWRGFGWSADDAADEQWFPQGITGAADAGRADLEGMLVVSWYSKHAPTQGARISVIRESATGPVYTHAVLAEPGSDGLAPLTTASGGALHAGGIVWSGDLLYVADTYEGFRVFDLRRFLPADPSRSDLAGGAPAGAYGHTYVLPQTGRYRLTSDSCRAKFSFAGFDRGTQVLYSGEYHRTRSQSQIVGWQVDEDGALQAANGEVESAGGTMMFATRLQGATKLGSGWIASASSQVGDFDPEVGEGPANYSPGALLAYTADGWTSHDWVVGAEAIYVDEGRGIWTAAEYPGRRDLIRVLLPE